MMIALLWSILAVPAAASLLALVPRTAGGALAVAAAGGVAAGLLDVVVAIILGRLGGCEAAHGWLLVDALGAWNLAVMGLVFVLGSLYAARYFGLEIHQGELTYGRARQMAALWCASQAAMTLVLVSNNLGLMWIAIEAITLITAFLICVHVTPTSLEAMWKYVLVCSVGIAFAFVGTLLAASAAAKLHLGAGDTLLWTRLRGRAAELDPAAMKAAFLFLLVGFGTKAGLAPMHSWLPDADSQAPAPVAAIFSGFMLNPALCCLMRYLPLVDAATGDPHWARELLVLFGIGSMLLGGAFMLFQQDLKRLLAYSSVEHVGVMALGLGLGGAGVLAALFHALNHALGKTTAFFAAGRLGQQRGTHDIQALAGSARTSPVWGGALLGSLLALLGAAPFAIFMSELQIAKAAVDGGRFWVLGLFLAAAALVFIGASRHALALAWGRAPSIAAADGEKAPEVAGLPERLLAWAPLAALLLLGLWMPAPVREAMTRAADVLGGGR